MLEIRLNLALMALAGLCWLAVSAHSAAPVLPAPEMAELSRLEDAVAHKAGSSELVALSEAYLERGFPGLAVATLRAAQPGLLEVPAVAHQLARAYEQSGRLIDALATADLALTRCSRVLGAGFLDTRVPSYSCSEHTLAKLDMHKGALERMARWGIVDPRRDPRAQRAYDLALRRARIAIGELKDARTP